MQKRLNSFEIRDHPVDLDPAFPIFTESNSQKDYPIRFLHGHQCLELGFCFKGRGVFVIGEKVIPFAEGDVSFITPAEVHLARSANGTTSEWAWIYLDPLRLLDIPAEDRALLDPARLAGPTFSNLIQPGEDGEIGRIVRRLVGELHERPPCYRSSVRGLVLDLIVRIHRLRGQEGGGGGTRRGFDRIAPALQIIARDYASPLRLQPLAKACGVSEPSLRRLFHAAVGRSPREYWHELRLRMASSFLRNSSLSVLEISQAVGFETLSSFNRLFRAHYGVPPRLWRKAPPDKQA